MKPLAYGAEGLVAGRTVEPSPGLRVRRGHGTSGRRPLVYASVAAVEQARRILPAGRCLEVEVAEAILAGSVIGGNASGRVLGDGWVAHVERTPGRLRPRPRAWLVVRLERRRSGAEVASR